MLGFSTSPLITRWLSAALGLALTGCGASANSERAFPEGAAPCKRQGWYVSPWSRCEDLCLPDDPEARVPRMSWAAAEQWCPACAELVLPWPNTQINHFSAVG